MELSTPRNRIGSQPAAIAAGLRRLWRRGQAAAGAAVRRFRLAADPGHRTYHDRSRQRRRSPSARGLVVVSANLCHDWPRHRRLLERLEAFARIVEREQAQLVLLQEVMRKPGWGVDSWLADRLGMEYVYSRANGHDAAVGFEEGLAIFSQHPILDTRLNRLTPPTGRFVHRWGLGAQVATPVGDLWAFSVHLSLRPARNRAQLPQLRSWVESVAAGSPALIGGDFNVPEHSSQIRSASDWWIDTFRTLNPQAEATTHTIRAPGGWPRLDRRLDYLFLHDGSPRWRAVEARHLEAYGRPHSDHRAVMARLTLSE